MQASMFAPPSMMTVSEPTQFNKHESMEVPKVNTPPVSSASNHSTNVTIKEEEKSPVVLGTSPMESA